MMGSSLGDQVPGVFTQLETGHFGHHHIQKRQIRLSVWFQGPPGPRFRLTALMTSNSFRTEKMVGEHLNIDRFVIHREDLKIASRGASYFECQPDPHSDLYSRSSFHCIKEALQFRTVISQNPLMTVRICSGKRSPGFRDPPENREREYKFLSLRPGTSDSTQILPP
jgi:hypothetical protein